MSSSMQVDSKPKIDVDEFLTTAISSAPDSLHPYFQSFTTLYQRRLWHQLTIKLFEFFREPASKPFQVNVFECFVRDFESRLNPLRLAEMGVIVSKEFDSPTTLLEFLKSLQSRIDKDKAPEAHVLLLSTIAQGKLTFGDAEGTRTDMDAALKILDSLDSVEPSVNAAYYAVASEYAKVKAEYGNYYKNALLYLACVDITKDLTAEARLLRAHDLGLAAFLSDTIYNFGELLMHPILDALDNTPHDWIKKLLFTFNEGNIGKFESLAPHFPKEPILQDNAQFLRQKICLMALIEAVFKRQGSERSMTFETIGVETRLPRSEVEQLVMKALSLKLIRGSLDEVDGIAHINWVQPRVLSREQIGTLVDRLGNWRGKLKHVEQWVTPQLPITN